MILFLLSPKLIFYPSLAWKSYGRMESVYLTDADSLSEILQQYKLNIHTHINAHIYAHTFLLLQTRAHSIMGGGIAPGKSMLHIILPTAHILIYCNPENLYFWKPERLKVTQGLCLHETILMEHVHHACMTPNMLIYLFPNVPSQAVASWSDEWRIKPSPFSLLSGQASMMCSIVFTSSQAQSGLGLLPCRDHSQS